MCGIFCLECDDFRVVAVESSIDSYIRRIFMISIKSQRELDCMKRAGEVVAKIHQRMSEVIIPGITTFELDRIAAEVIKQNGAISSFKGFPSSYGGIDFPGVICSSVNQQVIHGIPGNIRLCEGDIVSVDVGAIVDGYHGDAARTFAVGKISEEAARLISVTIGSYEAGASMALPGKRVQDISTAVENVIKINGYTAVRDYVGHGIGTEMHEEPQIPNYVSKERGPRLQAGMTLAIEPMVNAGSWKVIVLDDKWTVVTADGKLSAHHENTILVTDHGPEILTRLY
jgi:methionyl aminopeptidase